MAADFLGCARALGRKRVVVSDNLGFSPLSGTSERKMKKRYGDCLLHYSDTERSRIEALPHDVLVRVVFCVEHEDLKQLFHVSKVIRQAALIAKQCHFAYNTPTKKTHVFGTQFGLDEFHETEAPNAPLRPQRMRLFRKKLADISIALFA